MKSDYIFAFILGSFIGQFDSIILSLIIGVTAFILYNIAKP